MSSSRDSPRPRISIAPARAWRITATLSGRLGRMIRNSGLVLVVAGRLAPELMERDIMASPVRRCQGVRSMQYPRAEGPNGGHGPVHGRCHEVVLAAPAS